MLSDIRVSKWLTLEEFEEFINDTSLLPFTDEFYKYVSYHGYIIACCNNELKCEE